MHNRKDERGCRTLDGEELDVPKIVSKNLNYGGP